ncbi:acyl carrier protein [Streptomyces sp. NPDC088785]|uniref:acyl carrier protein n=1 Tax=Streptomyces sp. NPDC088785 TaxID=3365897 RepID=UPI0038242D63
MAEMGFEEALKTVRNIIAEKAECELEEVGPDVDLQEALGMDSMTVTRVVGALEEKFDITITDNEVFKVYEAKTPTALTHVALELQAAARAASAK